MQEVEENEINSSQNEKSDDTKNESKKIVSPLKKSCFGLKHVFKNNDKESLYKKFFYERQNTLIILFTAFLTLVQVVGIAELSQTLTLVQNLTE